MTGSGVIRRYIWRDGGLRLRLQPALTRSQLRPRSGAAVAISSGCPKHSCHRPTWSGDPV